MDYLRLLGGCPRGTACWVQPWNGVKVKPLRREYFAARCSHPAPMRLLPLRKASLNRFEGGALMWQRHSSKDRHFWWFFEVLSTTSVKTKAFHNVTKTRVHVTHQNFDRPGRATASMCQAASFKRRWWLLFLSTASAEQGQEEHPPDLVCRFLSGQTWLTGANFDLFKRPGAFHCMSMRILATGKTSS